jgi:hypothetical protein
MVPRELAPVISALQAERRHDLDRRREHARRHMVTIEESGDGGIGAMR